MTTCVGNTTKLVRGKVMVDKAVVTLNGDVIRVFRSIPGE
jgi:hypothetical protein